MLSDGDAPGATRARGGSARPSQAGGAADPAAGSDACGGGAAGRAASDPGSPTSAGVGARGRVDRKSTRLNSSHVRISYAVLYLKIKQEFDTNLMQIWPCPH